MESKNRMDIESSGALSILTLNSSSNSSLLYAYLECLLRMKPFVDYLNRNIGIIKRQYSRLLEALKKDGSIQKFWKDHSPEYKFEDFRLLVSQLEFTPNPFGALVEYYHQVDCTENFTMQEPFKSHASWMTCNKCSKPLLKRVVENPSILYRKKPIQSTDDFKTQISEGNGLQNDTYYLKGIVMIPFGMPNYGAECYVSDGPNWMNYREFSSIQVPFESMQQKLRSYSGHVEYFYQRVNPNPSEESGPEHKQDKVSENKNSSDSPQKRPSDNYQIPAAGDKSTVSSEELGTNKHDNKPSINALENTKVADSDLEQHELTDKTNKSSSTKVNRDFFKKHLLHGIKNNGNTCYTIECFVRECFKHRISNQLCKNIWDIYSDDNPDFYSSYTPIQTLQSYFAKLGFKIGQQGDAHQWLRSLLPELNKHDNEVKHKGVVSWIDELFELKIHSSFSCKKCGGQEEDHEESYELTLNASDHMIGKNSSGFSMNYLISFYQKGPNFLESCSCDMSFKTFRREITHTPRILVIKIERSNLKSTIIYAPMKITVSNNQYQLNGVIEHYSKHYTATVKDPEDFRWKECNDSTVWEIKNPNRLFEEYGSRTSMLYFYLKGN